MLILQGGRILDPSTDRDELADVLIDDGRIAAMGPAISEAQRSQARRVDVTGCWVTPGFIDVHTHLREPGYEYKEDIASGLRAAAAGGFTTVCTMANTRPVNDTRAVTEMMVHKARAHGGTRLIPFGAITQGLAGTALTEMADLREAGALGVSDDGRCVMNAAVMRSAMEYAATFDLLVVQHCEDHHLTAGSQMHEGAVSAKLGLRGWPREAEDIIVARDLLLAELTGARYHVAHVSSAGAIRLLREAKSRGLPVSAEVTPHHLSFTDADVVGYNTACKVNPPLRSQQDRLALVNALADGTIDCVATDHAPHSTLEKDCEFEAASVGINGLETALPLLLELVRTEALTPLRLVEALSTAPARLLSDFAGGTLRQGARADVTVLAPDKAWTIRAESLQSRSHNTPLLEREVRGAVQMTVVNGQVVHQRAES